MIAKAPDPQPRASGERADGPASVRRVAICVFADAQELARFMRRLDQEGVAVSAIAARSVEGPAMTASFNDEPSLPGQSGWADFVDVIQQGTTRTIATRLANALAAGSIVTTIRLSDRTQECRIVATAVESGALSVQLHDLAR